MNFRKLFIAAGLVGALTLLGAGAAVYAGTQANTIGVTTTADEYGTGTGCSLREAITAANTDQAFGGCPTGSGDDIIKVKAGTYKIWIDGADVNNVNGDKVGTYPSPVQAMLSPLASNGGYTQTHAPQPGGPAIDAGNPNGCQDQVLLGTDQRGFACPVNGDGDGGVRCDSGAVEKGSNSAATPTPNPCAQKPAAPSLDTPVSGTVLTTAKVQLNWDGVPCATKYQVQVRQDSKTGLRVFKKSLQTTELQTKALAMGHKYYRFVKACNDARCTKSQVYMFKLK